MEGGSFLAIMLPWEGFYLVTLSKTDLVMKRTGSNNNSMYIHFNFNLVDIYINSISYLTHSRHEACDKTLHKRLSNSYEYKFMEMLKLK